MPRDGAIIFRDLVGKLTIVRVECEKCGRDGTYRLDRLISRYGLDTKLFEWMDELTGRASKPITHTINAVRIAQIC
jgi:hypothetical protein